MNTKSSAEQWLTHYISGPRTRFVTDDDGNVVRDLSEDPETSFKAEDLADEHEVSTAAPSKPRVPRKEKRKMPRHRKPAEPVDNYVAQADAQAVQVNDLLALVSAAVAKGVSQTYGQMFGEIERVCGELSQVGNQIVETANAMIDVVNEIRVARRSAVQGQAGADTPPPYASVALSPTGGNVGDHVSAGDLDAVIDAAGSSADEPTEDA